MSLAKRVLKPFPNKGAVAHAYLTGFAFVLLALALGYLAIHWVVRNEVIHSSIQVGNAVPPIPSLTAVLLLGIAAALWRGRGRGSARARIFTLYIFLTVAAAIPSTASMSFFFAFLTVPRYLAIEKPAYRPFAEAMPAWYAPADTEAVRLMFRGSPDGSVPWHVWTLPLLGWGLFLFVLILTLYAFLALLRRPWMEGERLTYPMVQIPLRLLETDGSRWGTPPLWRDPVMWVGFALEAAFDGVNMLHTAWPSVPDVGTSFDVGGLFPDRPWSALAPFVISYRPEIFGIGFLMPTDVLLTTGFSYVALRLSTVWRVAMGEQVPSTAYDYQELGIGAFLALFGLILWRAWPTLRGSLREAFGLQRKGVQERARVGSPPSPPIIGGTEQPSSKAPPIIGGLGGPTKDGPRTTEAAHPAEPLSPRVAWLIVLLGTGAMILWLQAAGLALWLGTAHLLILMAVAIVYARMRAETGAPMIYLFPFWQQQTVLTNFLGTDGVAGGSLRSFTLFNSLGGLSRGFYPEICAYGSEGMSLASRAGFSQRRVTAAVIGGLALGLILGGYCYITAYYQVGGLLLDGGSGRGGYRIYLATQQYEQFARVVDHAELAKPDLVFQTLLGAALVVLFGVLRQQLLWFPLHPMGFAMASAYGYHLWAPFLAAWALKTLILRFGGHLAYRRLVPLFLGFALGRYLFAGIVWGLLGVFGSPVTKSYVLHFG